METATENVVDQLAASRQKYCQFVDKLCEMLGIPDSKSMYEACHLLINDIPFSLGQGDQDDEDSLYIYCDFGKPADEVKAVVLERLMQTNLAIFGNGTPTFGLNAESGHIILMHRMVISEMGFESLTYVLSSFVDHVKRWRDTVFMPEGPDMQKAIQQIITPPVLH
jgi:hypothetical protein